MISRSLISGNESAAHVELDAELVYLAVPALYLFAGFGTLNVQPPPVSFNVSTPATPSVPG